MKNTGAPGLKRGHCDEDIVTKRAQIDTGPIVAWQMFARAALKPEYIEGTFLLNAKGSSIDNLHISLDKPNG